MNITPQDQCFVEFQNLKFRKSNSRYIIFKVHTEKIVIDKIGQKECNWDQFLEELPNNEYRFAVYDFQFTNSDNMPISKLIFVIWGPLQASIKNKVLYATAKQSFRKYLDLNTRDFTLNSKSQVFLSITQFNQKQMIKELSK